MEALEVLPFSLLCCNKSHIKGIISVQPFAGLFFFFFFFLFLGGEGGRGEIGDMNVILSKHL